MPAIFFCLWVGVRSIPSVKKPTEPYTEQEVNISVVTQPESTPMAICAGAILATAFVIMGIILLAVLILPFIIKKPLLTTLSPLIAVIEYGYQNNKMMTYVENHLYH